MRNVEYFSTEGRLKDPIENLCGRKQPLPHAGRMDVRYSR